MTKIVGSISRGQGHEILNQIENAIKAHNGNPEDVASIFIRENFFRKKVDEFLVSKGQVIGDVTIDPWSAQKAKLVRFYKEIFGKDISFEGIKMPEYTKELSVLGFMDRSINGKMMIQAYKRLFENGSVYDNGYSKDIDKMIKEQQSRPEGNYAFSHAGGIEPDKLHLNKSYDDFHNDGNNYMVPLEGIMFALQYHFETGNMLDVKGVTRFHALDADGRVLSMYRDDVGQFHLDWFSRGNRHSDFGPRQVNF